MYYRAGYRRRNSRAGGCFVLFIGLVFLIVGIFIARETLKFLPGTLSAQGMITACHFNEDNDDSSSTCSPDVRFQTQSGQTISFRSSVSSSFFHQGDSVTVRYHPATPQDGRIDSFFITLLLPLVFVGVGLFVSLLGILALLRGIVRRMMGFV